MAKQPEEINKIERIRTKITKITELISQKKSVIALIKENPACSVVTMLILGFLTAFISKRIIQLISGLIIYGLKAALFLHVVKHSMSYVLKFKR